MARKKASTVSEEKIDAILSDAEIHPEVEAQVESGEIFEIPAPKVEAPLKVKKEEHPKNSKFKKG